MRKSPSLLRGTCALLAACFALGGPLAFWGCAKAPPKVSGELEDNRLPMPADCTGRGGDANCLPAPEWADRACQGVYPEVALYMMRGDTPWQRLYLLARAQGINASGGVSVLDTPLEPGEEVIALRRHGGDEGIRVSDTSGYDVMRWDGSCVTLHDGEFTNKPPRKPGHSRVEWPRLGEAMQQMLRKDNEVNAAFRARRNECKGAYFGPVTDRCVKLDHALIHAIVEHVRDGAELPVPEARP